MNNSSNASPLHVIFGAGLIGGYLGGSLLQADTKVYWIARESVKKKLLGGLTLTDYQGHERHSKNLNFVDSSRLDSDVDVLWITVKCHALESSLDEIRRIKNPKTLIISLQNGLGAEKILQAAFPENQVVRGVMAANVVERSPGHLHRGTEGGIDILDCAATRALQSSFNTGLLPYTLHQNIEGLIWAKLQLNLNNAINAVANLPLKTQLSDRHYRKILAAAQSELLAVVRKKSIVLPKLTAIPMTMIPSVLRLPNWLFQLVSKKMLAIDPEARSSMWCDLQEGKKTEIDFLNAAVVAEGKKLGLQCPVNQGLTELIGMAERGEARHNELESWDV